MTNKFLGRCGFLDEYATAADYERMEVIEAAMDALSEGVGDRRTIITALSYTHTTYYELLDSIKEALVKLAQRALSALNNHYINNVKLYQKYQEIIKKGLARVNNPIIHETWEYPEVKNYPRVISTGLVEKDIIRIHTAMREPEYGRASMDVDRLLTRFAKDVTDGTVDPYNIKGSITSNVEKRLRGRKITRPVNLDTIDDFFRTISDYHRDREDIKATQKAIFEDYDKLKRIYKAVTERPAKLLPGDRSLKRLSDGDQEDFLTQEYNRYASIHVEMMRLFNGYLAIYNTAFSTKLRILDDKYQDYRNVLIELFTKTGAMAAMTSARTKGKPTVIPYNPRMEGFKT